MYLTTSIVLCILLLFVGHGVVEGLSPGLNRAIEKFPNPSYQMLALTLCSILVGCHAGAS